MIKCKYIFHMFNNPKFLMDEDEISKKIGVDINVPIRVFNLGGLGIGQEEFIKTFAPSFSNLEWDLYDAKIRQYNYLLKLYPEQNDRLKKFIDKYFDGKIELNDVDDLINNLPPEKLKEFQQIAPYRRRSIARFKVKKSNNGSYDITREEIKIFFQDADKNDYRSKERRFAETSSELISHPLFQRLLNSIISIFADVEPNFETANLDFHQICIITKAQNTGESSPEGIHQDGVDYNVSALVIERDNVIGGESIIYGPDKKTEYLKIILQPGEGIFQADKKSDLWHYATPISLDPTSKLKEGKRSIFGFDFNIIK